MEGKPFGDGAGDRTIHIKILGHDELRAGHRCAMEDGGVQGRKDLGPIRIGSVDAIVDDGRAPADLASAGGVGGICLHHLDIFRDGGGAAAIDHAHALSLFVEFAHDCHADGAGAEDHMQLDSFDRFDFRVCF